MLKGENGHGYIFELDQREYEILVGFVLRSLGQYTGNNYTLEEIKRSIYAYRGDPTVYPPSTVMGDRE